MRLIDADVLAEIYADRMCKVSERYGLDSSEAGILSGAYKLLESMPTITPEPHWIPCSERLPEEGCEALGTDNYGSIHHVIKDKCGAYEFATYEEMRHIPIVAWQPLPAPYQEGADE